MAELENILESLYFSASRPISTSEVLKLLDDPNYDLKAIKEAIINLEDYKILSENLSVPILANITEFGMTPLYTEKELLEAGVDMILHPLSAFRAMSKAAEEIYNEISNQGTVEKKLKKMQSRDELYDVLNYHSYEEKIDNLFSKE